MIGAISVHGALAVLLGSWNRTHPSDGEASDVPRCTVTLGDLPMASATDAYVEPPADVPHVDLDAPWEPLDAPDPSAAVEVPDLPALVPSALDWAIPVPPPVVTLRSRSQPTGAVSQTTAQAATPPTRRAVSGEPLHSDRVDIPPRERADNPLPVHPASAGSTIVTGEVLLRILIDEVGRIEDVRVLHVTGDVAFERAVLDVIRRWSFEPARHRGRPVRVFALKRFRFGARP